MVKLIEINVEYGMYKQVLQKTVAKIILQLLRDKGIRAKLKKIVIRRKIYYRIYKKIGLIGYTKK